MGKVELCEKKGRFFLLESSEIQPRAAALLPQAVLVRLAHRRVPEIKLFFLHLRLFRLSAFSHKYDNVKR